MKFLDTIEKKIYKCNSSFSLKGAQTPKVQKKSISLPYSTSMTLPEIAAIIRAKNGRGYGPSMQPTDLLTYTETHSAFDIVSNSKTAVNSWDGDSVPRYLPQMMTIDTPLESSDKKLPSSKYSTRTRPSTPLYCLTCDCKQTSPGTLLPTVQSPSQITTFEMSRSTSQSPPPFTTFELPGSIHASPEAHLHPLPFLAYPEVLPQGPRTIVADMKAYTAYVIARRTQKRNLVTYNASEGPLEALYQLYELLMLDRLQEIQMAAKNFFHNYSWTIAEIQNPVDDPDRERYTVLACMLHLLVKTFNENIAAGVSRGARTHLLPGEKMALGQGTTKVKFESVPKWAQNVPPLDNTLFIPYCKCQDGQTYLMLSDWADERACTIFKTKRILLWKPNMNWRA